MGTLSDTFDGFEQLFEAANVAIIVYNSEAEVEFANIIALKAMGFSRLQEIQYKNLLSLTKEQGWDEEFIQYVIAFIKDTSGREGEIGDRDVFPPEKPDVEPSDQRLILLRFMHEDKPYVLGVGFPLKKSGVFFKKSSIFKTVSKQGSILKKQPVDSESNPEKD